MLLAFVFDYCSWEYSGTDTIIFEHDSLESAYLELCKRVEEEFKKPNPFSIVIGDMDIAFCDLLGTNMTDNSVDKESVLKQIEACLVPVEKLVQEL